MIKKTKVPMPRMRTFSFFFIKFYALLLADSYSASG